MSISEHIDLYLRAKLRVLPVVGPDHGGKSPAIVGWQMAAQPDLRTFQNSGCGQLWKNVGIVTGGAERLAVLDVDPRNGGDASLKELELKFGRLPDTPIVHTGGGGEHYYFRTHSPLRSRSAFCPGLDIKAEGGFVVAPPSQHMTRPFYEWDGVLNLETVPLAQLPAWLLDLLSSVSNCTSMSPSRFRGAISQRLTQGQRNNVLTSVAGHLMRRYVEPELAVDLLHAANEAYGHPPLPREEVCRIAESVARLELNRRKGR